jgi:2-iminobutanoate/2-iminopropanoate deaminase
MPRRQVLKVLGCDHENPIPTAVKIGRMVYTSAIIGSDASGKMPVTVEDEVANIFRYMREIMALAGGSTDDIAQVNVYVTDRAYKPVINNEWLRMFPDEHDRPARHTSVKDLRNGLRVQVEMTAVLED